MKKIKRNKTIVPNRPNYDIIQSFLDTFVIYSYNIMIYDSTYDNCMRSPDGQATEFVQL